MAMTNVELEEVLKELDGYRGRATELISVYISEGYDVNSVQKQLEAEKSTAKNIKSTSTRKNVSEALDKIVRHLKTLKKTPPNGLAVFAGNVSSVEGQDDLQLWAIEPPLALKIRLYRCDKEFVLETLHDQLSVSEIFGLVVMDRKEATIGVLEGKRIELIQKMTSGIPSKVRAGGQCLSPDTLIMKDDGEIIEIKDSHNPLIVVSENFNEEKSENTPIIAKWENDKELFKVTTCYPKFEIKSSGEHTFFVRTENGIEEKPLCEIQERDYLIMPEKINVDLENQKVNFTPLIKQNFNMKKINIPEKMNSDFARLLGYYLGDGSYEIDRITFFEQRKDVAEFYQRLVKNIFGIDSDLRFRDTKNYWQLRVYSRIVSQLFNFVFSSRDKTLKEKVPSIVLKSSDKSLASFIAGFFDAEGYVSNRVAFGINNKLLAQQIQFTLLRLGIISSINEYDNRRNPYSDNMRYTLAIDDLESLKKFEDEINFCSEEKRSKLREFIENRSNRNKVRQLVVNGNDVARILRNSGLNTRDFHCGYFFCNKRQMSKEVFRKNILD
ncbi:MAG: LAGLIDADG family homing endonuclease, partial [Nanoarchaeota archaeon]